MKKILVILCLFLLNLQAKERLVVLDPASIETLFMLESGDLIVGRASLQHSNIYPESETSKIQSVGSFSNPSLEKIVALKPSLVILGFYSLNLEEGLKSFGIKSISLKAENFNDLKQNIKTLAKLANKEQKGDELIKEFNESLKELSKNPLNKSAIYLYSSNPLMAFNDTSLIAEILKIIGIENKGPKTNVARPVISSEFILKQNPDIIVLGISADKKNLDENSLLKNAKAIKQNQVYTNKNTHILLRLSPKIVDRIKEFKNNLKQGTF